MKNLNSKNNQLCLQLLEDMNADNQKEIVSLLMNYDWSQQEAIKIVLQNGKNKQKWKKTFKSLKGMHQKQIMSKLEKIIQFQNKITPPIVTVHDNLKNISIKLNTIEKLQIKIYNQADKLTAQINQAIERRIRNQLKQSISIGEYLQKEIYSIIEILQIKGSLLQYYNILITLSKNVTTQSLLPLRQMTFIDFIILLKKFIEPNDALVFLLSKQVQTSIPIVFKNQLQLTKDIKSCRTFLGFQNYSLIVNLGTKGTQTFNKTHHIYKIMNIPEKYIKNTAFQNILNLQRVYSPQQKIILTDLNGQFKPNQSLLTKLYSQTSLLIFHATEEQINKGVIEEISFVFQSIEKFIIFVWNDSNFNKQKYKSIQTLFKQGTMIQIISLSSKNVFQEVDLGLVDSFFKQFREKFFNIRSFYQSKTEQSQFTIIQKNLQQYSKNHPKEVLFPKLSTLGKIRQLKTKINNQGHSEENTILKAQLEKQTNFEVSLKFIDSCRKHLRSITQSFTFFLSELLKYTVKANNQPHITVDKIIQQLSIYSQSIIDKSAERPNSDEQNIINNFYQRCFDQLHPCNIIDRQTSSFGNKSFQRFLQIFNQQLQKKKKNSIFVVSAIGSRGPGKRNLINYLFRHNFYSRQTIDVQGVYISLCQIDNKVIIFLDVEGIQQGKHQTSTQEIVFAHQTAAFIMKISNVVLITHYEDKQNAAKQNINQLKQTLQISRNFFNNFKEKDYKKECLKVFLAIEIQDVQILKKQVQSYKKIFEGFIDIIVFPNIFKNNAQNIVGNQGSFILKIKNSITDYLFLQNFKVYRSIIQFYKAAKADWQLILNISKNLFQSKTIEEAMNKQKELSAYKDSYKSYREIINAYFTQRNKESQAKIKIYFANSKNLDIEQFFKNEEKSIKNLESFLKQFKIKKSQVLQRLYNCFYQQSRQHYENQIREFLLLRKIQFQQIIEILLNIYSNQQKIDIQKKEISKFQTEAKHILHNLDRQFKNVKIQKIKTKLARVFQVLLESQTIIQGLNINHINNCVDFQEKIKKSYIYNIQSFVFFQSKLNQVEKANISNIIYDYVQKIEILGYDSQIEILNRFDKIKILQNVQELSLRINTFNKNAYLIKINYTTYLLGFLFTKIIQNIKEKLDQQNEQKKKKIKTIIDDKRLFLIKFIQYQKEFIDKIKKHIQQLALQINKNVLHTILDQKIKNAETTNIVLSVLNETINRKNLQLIKTKPQELFTFYKNCFKIVKNANKFIGETIKRLKRSLMSQNELINIIKKTSDLIKLTIRNIRSNPKQNQFFFKIIQQIVMKFNDKYNHQKIANTYAEKLINLILQKQDKQISDKVKRLAIDYIETNLNMRICYKRCQKCGAICGRKLPHNLHEFQHNLEAFGGTENVITKTFSLKLCIEKKNILEGKTEETEEKNPKQISIEKGLQVPKESGLQKQLDTSSKGKETGLTSRNQMNIWANIQDAMIYSKYQNFQSSIDNNLIKEKNKSQLTIKDMEELQNDQEGNKYPLKDY